MVRNRKKIENPWIFLGFRNPSYNPKKEYQKVGALFPKRENRRDFLSSGGLISKAFLWRIIFLKQSLSNLNHTQTAALRLLFREFRKSWPKFYIFWAIEKNWMKDNNPIFWLDFIGSTKPNFGKAWFGGPNLAHSLRGRSLGYISSGVRICLLDLEIRKIHSI